MYYGGNLFCVSLVLDVAQRMHQERGRRYHGEMFQLRHTSRTDHIRFWHGDVFFFNVCEMSADRPDCFTIRQNGTGMRRLRCGDTHTTNGKQSKEVMANRDNQRQEYRSYDEPRRVRARDEPPKIQQKNWHGRDVVVVKSAGCWQSRDFACEIEICVHIVFDSRSRLVCCTSRASVVHLIVKKLHARSTHLVFLDMVSEPYCC